MEAVRSGQRLKIRHVAEGRVDERHCIFGKALKRGRERDARTASIVMLVIGVTVCAGVGALCENSAAAERELLSDPDFSKGLVVLDPTSGKKVQVDEIGLVSSEDTPEWQLAQWHSKYSLAGVEGEKLSCGAVCFANEAKTVVLAANGDEYGDITLGVDTGKEYGPEGRREDEAWPHLLVCQPLDRSLSLSSIGELRFHCEARLRRSKRLEIEGYNPRIHAAQFVAHIIVQNRKRQSAGYGDFMWFGIPIYDSRGAFERPFIAPDAAHAKLIYTPSRKRFCEQAVREDEWVMIDKNILPLMLEGLREAWHRGYLTGSKELLDYRPTAFSIGWEVPGTFDVSMQVRDLSLRVR